MFPWMSRKRIFQFLDHEQTFRFTLSPPALLACLLGSSSIAMLRDMFRGFDGGHRVVGLDTSSSVSSLPMHFNRISSSQDSYTTSQPTGSLEDSPLDGGRSQARFHEFVARSRHMELLEILHELRTKITGLDEKVEALSRLLNDHSSQEVLIQKFDELLHNSVSDLSLVQSLDSSVFHLSQEIHQNSSKIDSFSANLQSVMQPRVTFTPPDPVQALKEAPPPAMVQDEDSDDDVLSLTDYLARKNQTMQASVISFSPFCALIPCRRPRDHRRALPGKRSPR